MSMLANGEALAPDILVFDGVVKSYGEAPVLQGVSFSVKAGEVVCVVGPSGSGKSTLLRCVNGLEKFTAGRILFEGAELPTSERSLAQIRQRIGMVFQHFELFPHMTVLGNVVEGPVQVLGESKASARARGLELLAKVGLESKQHERPANLSGGQQQRVAIARALAMRPDLMLFDEATSALDPQMVGEVLGVMKQLADDGMTMLIVTHEMGFAKRVADRVVVLDQGQVIASGPPSDVLENSANPRVREFLQQVRWDGAEAEAPRT
ncbi:amino acid ABC transporter ATP-binding protein [Nocardioides daeguensis]